MLSLTETGAIILISLILRDINSTLITFDHFIITRAKTVFRFFRNFSNNIYTQYDSYKNN